MLRMLYKIVPFYKFEIEMYSLLKATFMLLGALLITACGSDSQPTAPDPIEKAPNTVATALFDIAGEFIEGQTITVTPIVTDADGIANAEYKYTWYEDGNIIADNSASSITLTAAQIDKSIYFELTFSDDLGNSEVISSGEYTVAKMANQVATAGFEIVGTFVEGNVVTVTPTVIDEDGTANAEYQYTWYVDNVALTDNNTNTITLTTSQIGKAVHFDLAFVDDRNNSELISSEEYTVVMMANRVATAEFEISGNFVEGQTVSVTPTITDADGIANVEYQYSWYANDIVVEGNSTNSIILTSEHIGKALHFDLAFNDDRGHEETISSEAHTVVMMANRVATADFEFSSAFEEQQTVKVTPNVNDADGVAKVSYSYQWYKDNNLVEGISGNEIHFTPADIGKSVHFVVSFFDDREHSESITSESYVVANKTEMLGFITDAYELFIGDSSDGGDTWNWGTAQERVKSAEVADSYIEQYYPSAVTDNKGNIVMVMDSEYYEGFGGEYDVVYTYSNDNGATFANVDLINANDTADSKSDYDAKIATDGNGYWVAAWTSYEDTLSNEVTGLGTDADLVYAVSTDNGATFSSPKPIGDYAFSDTKRDRMPAIAITENIWTMVWSTDRDLTGGAGVDEDIVYSYSLDKGTTWTDPVYINDWAAIDSNTDYFSQIAINSSGYAVVIWAGQGAGVSLDIYAAVSTDFGKTWGDSVLINQDAGSDISSYQDYPTHVEVSEDNIAVISWHGKSAAYGSDRDVYFSFSKDLGKSWSKEQVMNPNADSDTENHTSLTIQQTPDGTWLATYFDYNSYKAYMRKSDDLITWTDPVLIKEDAYYSGAILFH